ncbi:hypothetical protein Sjap_019998 [Stephania japonica]|uniref:Uncharacterized protein n=1 Tax=Stephania japonica TaxID=461633 RepID=A0AAP0F8V1_9MAGN
MEANKGADDDEHEAQGDEEVQLELLAQHDSFEAPPQQPSYAYQALSDMFIFRLQQLEDCLPPPRLMEDGPSRSAHRASSQ